MRAQQIAARLMKTGMCFADVEGARMQACHHVAGRDEQEALARELVRLSAAVPERPVVWVLWIDRPSGSVAYSREYADDVQWLAPGPHFTRAGVYETEAAVKAAVRKEEDYFAKLATA